MVLEVYEALRTTDGWVRGGPIVNPEEVVNIAMCIIVPEVMQNQTETIRDKLETGFNQ